MKIRIDDIPEAGLELHFSGKDDTLSAAIQTFALPEGTGISPKVKGTLQLVVGEEDFFLSGNVQIAATLQCSRCLADFPVEQILDLQLVIHRHSAEPSLRDEEALADADTILLDGPEIDIGAIIVQEALLDLPMKPLCSEGCPGLCPTCGTPAGSKECTCRERKRSDPRWDALAQLKAKMTE